MKGREEMELKKCEGYEGIILDSCQLNRNIRKEGISNEKLPQEEWPVAVAIYMGAFSFFIIEF